MFSHIIEPGLELRIHEERFVEEVYNVCVANREHLRQFMPWADKVKSADDTRDFIKRGLQQFASNNGFQCGIWERGRFVGAVGFHWIKWDAKLTEIGYWLAADAQGRGLMTKACRALIAHAFDAWKLNKVEIRCDVENARSRAVPKRLGFVEEGTLRRILQSGSGEMRDGVVYGMLAEEWRAKRS